MTINFVVYDQKNKMSEEEHSENEFYYPKVDIEEYKSSSYHIDEVQREDVYDYETQDNSRVEIDEFIRCQKSANTVTNKCTDMNVFYRYLARGGGT